MKKLLSLLASLAMLTTMSPFYTEGTKDNYDDVDSLADSSEAINSETKECCTHPCYHDITYTSAHKFTCDNCTHCSNDENNSSDEISGDKTQFRFVGTEYTSAYSVKEGIKTPIENTVCCGIRRASRVTDFDYINVDMNREYEKYKHFGYSNSKRLIDITLADTTKEVYADLSGSMDISDNMVNIVNKGDFPINSDVWISMEEGTYNFAPYFQWNIWGDIDKNLSIEVTENGLLLKSDDKIEMSVSAERYITDKNGEIQYGDYGLITDYATVSDSPTDKDLLVTIDDEQKVSFYVDKNNDGSYDRGIGKVDLTSSDFYHISSENNVLVTVNEEQKIVCYIDDNNDGVYDSPVQKGDANYDGVIDASDASAVLAHYAKLSTSSENKNILPIGTLFSLQN